MTDPIIAVDRITKHVPDPGGALTILHEISFNLQRQQSVAIVGASGSGKSTLLSIIAGLDTPSSGSVRLAGTDLFSLDEDARAAVRAAHVGFVFQSFQLLGNLTAIENVMLPLAAAKMPNRRQRELAGDALSRVSLADKTARLPRDLSGGEQQRVAIARAIVNAPPLLLADEPTGCLDSRTGREIIDVFQSLREGGLTVFLVTHDAAIAARADRIVHVCDGRILDEEAAPVRDRATA